MAISSELLNAAAPFAISFSLGRSSIAHFLIGFETTLSKFSIKIKF
jgi:hypothetical protein